ncbi:isochorismatase family protein [Candidatus Entotheonella palauensis]|uniref:isochorismatase family protein n=1 Tax=Candidatus Entotheonella palauensis TaxID=93172 RepID=UPI000B7DCC4D|nr:isochorismatase family cysteine hydrolase [Candidatus Entotheonella palauensis]
MHQTNIHSDILEIIKQKRGGKLHVHDTLDPARTALVVVDMQVAFLKPGLPSEVPMAREIVPTINRLARAFRAAGGTVVWVYNTFTEAIFEQWSSFLGGTYAPEVARAVAGQLMEGAEGHPIWPEMDVRDEDVRVAKNRFSAFLPGASDIEEQLHRRGIDTVAITGTLTNVCCESSARDAMMRNFHVIMLPDGNATYNDVLHNASLTTLSITFADLMTSGEVITALGQSVIR